MTDTIDIRVPDIGDFDDVEVIEVLVAAGDPDLLGLEVDLQRGQPLDRLEAVIGRLSVPANAD